MALSVHSWHLFGSRLMGVAPRGVGGWVGGGGGAMNWPLVRHQFAINWPNNPLIIWVPRVEI